MTTKARFVVLKQFTSVILDQEEEIVFKLETKKSAVNLCNKLNSLHNTVGNLLEELDTLRAQIRSSTGG